jgi:hypothetical protein
LMPCLSSLKMQLILGIDVDRNETLSQHVK